MDGHVLVGFLALMAIGSNIQHVWCRLTMAFISSSEPDRNTWHVFLVKKCGQNAHVQWTLRKLQCGSQNIQHVAYLKQYLLEAKTSNSSSLVRHWMSKWHMRCFAKLTALVCGRVKDLKPVKRLTDISANLCEHSQQCTVVLKLSKVQGYMVFVKNTKIRGQLSCVM